MNSTISEEQLQELSLPSLAAQFAQLVDQRCARGRRYALVPLLVLWLLAKLCGEDHPTGIAEWVAHRQAWLCEGLALAWRRMPHAATWRRLLAQDLAVAALEELAGAFLQRLSESPEAVLNLDGKTLRGTIAAGASHGLHLLAVQAQHSQCVWAQQAVMTKENEIRVAPQLLAGVALQGKVVTADALHTQQALSRQIVEAGGDYLWRVKENQPTLYAQLQQAFATPPPRDAETAQTLEKGHGRIEARRVTSSAQVSARLSWPYVSQAFRLQRTVTDCRTGQVREETAYGITSLAPLAAGPERLLAVARGHWSIENGLHYRRDVTFREDACRMKSHRAAQVLAVFNNLALGLLRTAGWQNLAAARRYYQAHLAEALALITKPFR